MNINEILSLILLIIVLSVFFITLKNNTNEPFLESCGTSWSQMTANCGSRKSSSSCRGWQDAAHSGGSPYKCYWSSSNKCKKRGEPCSTEQATAMDAERAEQDRLARLADEARIAQEKIDAKNAACGPIDTPQYDTPNWSYGGVIQGNCENYIDPEIEQQNKENAKNAACGPTNITQHDTPYWSYNGDTEQCENYIDPAIEEQNKENAKNAACGPTNITQHDTPYWSYNGDTEQCENYIDPAIEEQNKENAKNRICGSTTTQSHTKEWSYNGVIQGDCPNYTKQTEPVNYSTQHLKISPTHVWVTNAIQQY